MNTQIKPRTAKVKIWQGDDADRASELAAEVQRLKPGKGATAAEAGEYQQAVDAHNAFIAEAEERVQVIVLRPLGRKMWRTLLAEHPPREGHAGDESQGVNYVTFGDALVPASIASPAWSDAEKEEFLDSLTDAQFEELYINAFALNRVRGADPKAVTPSAETPNGSAT